MAVRATAAASRRGCPNGNACAVDARTIDRTSAALRHLQTQTHGRRRRTLGTVRRPSAGAKHRHQRLSGFAVHRTVGLDRSKADRRDVALLAPVTLLALITVSTGCAPLAG